APTLLVRVQSTSPRRQLFNSLLRLNGPPRRIIRPRSSAPFGTCLSPGAPCRRPLVNSFRLGGTQRLPVKSASRPRHVQRWTQHLRYSQICAAPVLRHLTIGSSDRGGNIFAEPKRESMIGINQLRLAAPKLRVAQPHR